MYIGDIKMKGNVYGKERNIECEYENSDNRKITVLGNYQGIRERFIRDLTVCEFIKYIERKESEKFVIHTENGNLILGDNIRYNDGLQNFIVYQNNNLVAFLNLHSIAVIDFFRSD